MVYLVYSMAMITLIGQSQHHRHREQATVDNKTLKSNVKSLPAVGLGRFRLGGLSTYREYKCCCSVPATWYTRKRAHAFVNSIAMASSAFIGERHMRAAHPGQGERTACMHSLALLLVPSNSLIVEKRTLTDNR